MKLIRIRKQYRKTKHVDKRMIIAMHVYYFNQREIAHALNTNSSFVKQVVNDKENWIGIETLYA
nr:hypothetical protein [uncultured Flavobacterium sp.]